MEALSFRLTKRNHDKFSGALGALRESRESLAHSLMTSLVNDPTNFLQQTALLSDVQAHAHAIAMLQGEMDIDGRALNEESVKQQAPASDPANAIEPTKAT